MGTRDPMGKRKFLTEAEKSVIKSQANENKSVDYISERVGRLKIAVGDSISGQIQANPKTVLFLYQK